MNSSRSAEHAGAAVHAEGRFRSILEPGERVLWTAQPRPFRIMRSKAAHALFGTIAIVAMTLTPVHGLIDAAVRFPVSTTGAMHHPIAWVVLCIACYTLVVPLGAYRKAMLTWYVVTDRRVLQVVGEKLVSTARLDEIESMSLRGLEEDGTGDILFSRVLTDRKEVLPRYLPGVVGVPDADGMYRATSEAMQEHAKKGQHAVHDYLEFLLQGKRPEDLLHR